MHNAQPLVDALREPETVLSLDGEGWTELVSMARAEQLFGSLAHRLADIAVPDEVKPVLKDAAEAADLARLQALWEADCARRVLAPLQCKTVLMKGTAYVAAGLDAGIGRSIGDLDIMAARDQLPAIEAALLDAGWEWVKPDPYDDQYYRDHMHELPPLIHRDRDRMIDVHHTTLPLTAG
ncbi:nucleotidyltransferase family protein, partial [Parasphingorhabdus sp.]|uniref:nucleotidyltransferase family protein n=1 Tax=Parasphingorhabdus sp. TaxID=2709688 RepID=UPI002F9513CB